jgi:mono/diheme cytochrome c family protein
LYSAACVAASAAGCTPDDEQANPAPVDAAKDAVTDAQAEADQGDLVARGDYLVNNVAACVDCHTPRRADGTLDVRMHLAGSTTPVVDVVPDDGGADGGLGKIYARNLTPDMETGLGKWTDDQIKKAFLDGVDDQDKPLFPIMPYYVFHNMTTRDADAIVAYLRTITPIKNLVPEREPVPGFTAAAQPVPVDAIPVSTIASGQPNYDAAQRGRYLAGQIGVCMECHTQHLNGPVPLDTTRLFAGDEIFHLPAPFGDVRSSNITPDPNGIKGWTPQNVSDLLKLGTNNKGMPICPPMPAGPTQAFGGLTKDDALDIGYYLTTIPGITSAITPRCTPPTPGDAGAADANNDDATTNDSSADRQAD